MSEGTKTLRLSKVAKEFNLSLGKIVEFLGSKGHPTDSNPNAKIGDEEYRLLLKEFSGDRSAREEAENVAQNAVRQKRETIVLDEIKPKKSKEEEVDEVVIKDLTIGNLPVVEKAPEPKIETPAEVETPAPAETPAGSGPKVLGKVDLSSMNLRTKPEKKSKKEKEPEVEKVAEVAEPATAPEPAAIEPAATIEAPEKEAPKEEFLETRYEKLEGPKILGRVELPVAKVPEKKGGPNSAAASAAACGRGWSGGGSRWRRLPAGRLHCLARRVTDRKSVV